MTFLTGMETGVIDEDESWGGVFMTFLTGMETGLAVGDAEDLRKFMTFLTGMETLPRSRKHRKPQRL